MGLHCGIVGLPNVGKSTLFNALTSGSARVANYPFTTIDPQAGIVQVPDARLDALARLLRPPAVIPTTIEFVDIAGLVRNASSGEGLGNQFLAHIREVDAIIHVVRCFADDDIIHVGPVLNPVADVEVVETELLLKDTDTVGRRLQDASRRAKGNDKKAKAEVELFTRLLAHLNSGKTAHTFTCADPDRAAFSDCHLLTDKPVLFVANTDEHGMTKGNDLISSLRKMADQRHAPLVAVDAALEAELSGMSYTEREEFLKDIGLEGSGLDAIIGGAYTLLNLITFFTHNEKEVRAWTVPKGTRAPQAAGVIHSDFEQGFIKAEVVNYADLIAAGSDHAAREKGIAGIHGHDYLVRDGDVILFRFN